MTKFKPCPFCGSENIQVRGYESYWVSCCNCGAEGSMPSSLWKSREDAIEAWNTRAGDEE